MATLKQIIFPIAVATVAIVGFTALNAMQEPMEEKPETTFAPLVKTLPLNVITHHLTVSSQGMVMPKEQTNIVAQVGGQVVEIADGFVKGAFVKKGHTLLRIDPSDYQSSLVEAQANLAAARAALQLEKARGHVAQTEWEEVNNAKPSELGLRKPQLAQEVAKVRAAQALVNKAQRNLDRTTIVAPYDAIVNDRQVSLGSVVNNGTMIGMLSATNVAQVRLPIADKDLAYLDREGIGANVSLSANFNGTKTIWHGKIIRNEGVIDETSRMHYLVAEVSKPYTQQKPLRFGSYVTAQVAGGTIENVAIVPRHLVVDNKLAVVSTDSTLHFKAITVLREQENDVLVKGDFREKSQYVSSALSYPIEGMALTIKNAKDSM